MTRSGDSVENQIPVTRAFSGVRRRRGVVGTSLRALGVLALVLALVVSPLAPFVMPAAAAPSGFVGVPDSNVRSDIPAHAQDQLPNASAFEGSTMTTRGADTLEVTLSTKSRAMGRSVQCSSSSGTRPEACTNPEFALVLSDDVVHSGRHVAVPVSALEDALGYVPEMAYGLHETGGRWQTPIQRKGGLAIFRVPKFSSNTVTFAGTVEITDSPALDGTSHTYEISDLDAASDPNVTFTGAVNAEWDNETGAGVSLGGSAPISVAGNLDPTGPSVNGDPTLEVTADISPTQYDGGADTTRVLWGTTSGGDLYRSEHGIDNAPDIMEGVRVYVSGCSSDGCPGASEEVDVYLVNESPDSTAKEGTFVANNIDLTQIQENSWNTIMFDTAQDTLEGTQYTIEFVTVSGDTTANYRHYTNVSATSKSGTDQFTEYHTSAVDTFDSEKSSRVEALGAADITADDNNSHSANFGTVSHGETVTKEFNVDLNSSAVDFNGAGAGSLDYTLHLKERTQTVDPAVEINGNWLNHTGKLVAGSSVSLTGNQSWIKSGTNGVNVSVGDGSLTADAPTPAVDVFYSHDAQDSKTVAYEAEAFSERYNVSKTYASDRTQADLTIPHQGTVLSMRSVEYRINESGGWSSVATSKYGFDGTTLEVDLDAVYGGEIPANTTVEIRSAASKVKPYNASITVLEVTPVGQNIDSKIRLDDWNSDSYLGVSNDAQGNLVHYLANASWSGADAYAKFDDLDRQRVFMPNAVAGGKTRVRTIPVKVAVPGAGQVHLDVDSPSSTEPKFHVSPGKTKGDTVQFTFVDAKDNTKYLLWSTTNEVVRDSGTANSPLTLEDDDSLETLMFFLDDDTSTTGPSGGDGSSSTGPGGPAGVGLGSNLLAITAAAALAAVWWLSKEYGDGQISTTMLFVGEAVLLGTIALEAFSPASIVGGISEALITLAGGLGVGIAQAMPLVILVAGVLLWRYLKSQDRDIIIQGRDK